MKKYFAVVMLLTAASLVGVVLFGRAPQAQEQQPPLRYDTSATVKLVTVRVLDAAGRPITGLRKEDFALTEDGQKKLITEFEVHSLTTAGMAVSPELPAAVEAVARKSGETNRKMFFFLDLQGSDDEGKAKAHAAALKFLDTQARPGDEAGVLGFSPMSGFFIREYLTADMDKVRRAIKASDELMPGPGEWVVNPAAGGGAGGRGGASLGNVGNGSVDQEGGVAEEPKMLFIPGTGLFQRHDFVDRMKDLVEVFKIIPGNKSLVLFSARDMGGEAESLGRLFGSTGTAVFAVNTKDWDVNFRGTKFKHIWWDYSLKNLSAASGGAYFADINDAGGIARDVQDLTGHFYVLGYYVKESWEGKYHKIRVEVASPGARVLVQDGYADPKPFASMTDFEKDLQLLDLIWSDRPLATSVPIVIDPLVVGAGQDTYACLLSKLEVGSKLGIPAAPVEIVALLRDSSGTAIVSRRWDIDLTKLGGRVIWPYLISSVPAGACELRLVVRDRENGGSCVGRARFDVAAAPNEGVVLSSPLLIRPGDDAAYLKLSQPKSGKSVESEKRLIDLYPLIPKASRPVVGEINVDDRRLEMVLRYEIRPAQAEDQPVIAVEAKLISRVDGSETPLGVSVLVHKKIEGSFDVLGAEITLPALTAGDYDLEISLEDLGRDERAALRKPLIIR